MSLPVRSTIEAGVARLTLARPEKRNALNREVAEALIAAVTAASDDVSVRVIAIAGDGADFCAGADLAALEALIDAPDATHRDDAGALARLFTLLRTVPVPTVAVVRGRALAGGAGLATACDIVLAHEQAQFGYPEVRVGFVPAMVMTMLRRAVGEKVAADLVLTGRLVGAPEAQGMGLVSRTLPDAGFEAVVSSILAGIARQPADAVARTKALLHALDSHGFEASLALGLEANVAARRTDAFRDGVRAFVARGARADQ